MSARETFSALIPRRSFLNAGAATLTVGIFAPVTLPAASNGAPTGPNMLGPLPGYSPQIGAFVSQLTWMREMNGVLRATEKLSHSELDYLFDKAANTIGALMLHL